jgi:tetratricopeptide (TPR) repeat protein
LEESVALNISVGARWNLGHAYQGLGAVAQAQGEHQRAVDMFRKGVDTFAELGGRFYVGEGLAEMGRSVFALGNDTEAERVWRESLRIATEIHGTPVALDALVGLASLRAKKGDMQSALELLLTVLNHPASIQDTRHRAEQLRTELEAQLTTHKVEAIKTRGQGKKFEAIVDELLTQESGYRVLGAGGIERGESK